MEKNRFHNHVQWIVSQRPSRDLFENSMNQINELAHLTLQSLEPYLPKDVQPQSSQQAVFVVQPTVAPATPRHVSITPPTHRPLPNRVYGSHKKEYQPALSDNALVDALLHLSKKREGETRHPSIFHPDQVFEKQEGPAAGSQHHFEFESIPEVEVTLKGKSGSFQRPSAPTQSILRSRDPNNPHG